MDFMIYCVKCLENKIIFKMHNQTKFSISNVTIDTDNNRAHDCPSCRCPSPRNKHKSPSPKPFERKNHIYYQQQPPVHLSNRNLIPGFRSQSPKLFGRPVSPNPKITIRYTSPQRQRLSEIGQRPPQRQQYSPYHKPSIILPQTHISSSKMVEEQHQQPKKPSILNRHNSGNKISTLITKKNKKPSTTNNYYKQEDEKEIASTIIRQLNLNYDYLTVNDVSDISADISI